jgi:hypothetical protein
MEWLLPELPRIRAAFRCLAFAAVVGAATFALPGERLHALEPASVEAGAGARLVTSLAGLAPTLRPDVLRLALAAHDCAGRQGLVRMSSLLTVIDYSLPSTEPRLWVFDLAARRLLLEELVAHGRNSGDNETTRFSNEPGSLQSSLGLFVTAEPYVGRNGYSLRLMGLEPGINDRALERAIVVHGAPYVSFHIAKQLGRLGRSWGCPAVPLRVARRLIDAIKGGSTLFAYYPDGDWLTHSRFLSHCSDSAN